MTERVRHIVKLALRTRLGVWFSDAELDRFVDYLTSQKIRIKEEGE